MFCSSVKILYKLMAPLRWLLHYLRKFLKVREVPRIGHLTFLSFLLGYEECSVLGRKILKTDKKEKVCQLYQPIHAAHSSFQLQCPASSGAFYKSQQLFSFFFFPLVYLYFYVCSNILHEFCHLGNLGIESHM